MTHDPRIGQDFGDYIITKKLAEGGMGAVYLAEHSSGMRKVVKFMLAECLQHPGIRQRFETECMAAKRLKGRSGIVEIDSFGVRNGEMYLVMEFIDGVTLDAHIRQNVRLTAHHTFHIAAQILRALDALHREGIIHRDLKPSNVFLRHTEDRAWDVKLIDFGIVHDKQSTTSTEFRTREGMMIGTPGYMATEQYGRADKVTAATDVFACAVMIWEMLTGQLPWGVAENEFAQHNRQLNQAPIWPQQVAVPNANGWPALLVPALAPEPDQRPQSAQAFALLLAERLEAVPPHVPSGLEMVQTLAPRFLLSAPPDLETIRQSGQLPASMNWPPRAQSGSGTPAASSPSLDAIQVSAVSAVPTPTPAFAATVNARPAPAPASANVTPAPMTTLSAMNGSSVATAPPRSSRSKLVAIGVVTAIVVAGVTFGVSRMSGKSSSGSDSSEPRAVTPQASPTPPPNAGNAPSVTPPDRGREQPAPQMPSAPTNVATPTAVPSPPAATETAQPASSNQAKKRSTPKQGSSATSVVKKGATTPSSPDKKGGTASPTTTTGANPGSASRPSGSAYDPDAIKE